MALDTTARSQRVGTRDRGGSWISSRRCDPASGSSGTEFSKSSSMTKRYGPRLRSRKNPSRVCAARKSAKRTRMLASFTSRTQTRSDGSARSGDYESGWPEHEGSLASRLKLPRVGLVRSCRASPSALGMFISSDAACALARRGSAS